MDGFILWIIFISLVIVILIAFGIFIQHRQFPPVDIPDDTSTNVYGPIARWGNLEAIVGETCSGYQFPTITTGSGFLKPGTPTLNYDILSDPGGHNITVSDPFTCLDSDRINAIKVRRQCSVLARPGANTNNVTCTGINGQEVKYLDYEELYVPCSSDGSFGTNIQPVYCPGQISGVSVGFQATSQTDFPCMKVVDENDILEVTEPDKCDLGEIEQQFRIVRTTPDNFPQNSRVEGENGQQGYLAKIVYRETEQCVVPNDDRDALVLGECDINQGYVWGLIPPVLYNGQDEFSSQQIVYVGDGDPDDFVKISLNNPEELYNYINSINAVSMANEYPDMGLQNYTKEGMSTTTGQDTNSQIASFALYNVIFGTTGTVPF